MGQLHEAMKERLTDEQIRDVRADSRERITNQKIVRLQVRAANENRTSEERAAANAEANRLSNILRARNQLMEHAKQRSS